MTARVLINGVLDKAPTRLTSKAGKPYLRASVKDGNGPDAKWWTVFVFSVSAAETLELLSVGEPIAASGPFEAKVWAPEGREPRVNLTLTADAILSARKPKAKTEGASRKPKEANGRARAEASNTGGRSIASKSWAAPATAEVGTPLAEKGAFDDDDVPF